jgi:BON domain
MTTSSTPDANILPFFKRVAPRSRDCPTQDCVSRAMAAALHDHAKSVSGEVLRGRAFLRGSVATEAERRQIERSVLRLHCVVDVINEVTVDDPRKPAIAPSAPVSVPNLPLIYVSSYCSLNEDALKSFVEGACSVLEKHLGGLLVPPEEVVVFYSCWHDDAAMVDAAIPSQNILGRRPANSIRGTVLPQTINSVKPGGGISGLKAARQTLASMCGKVSADPMFRIWQRMPLIEGRLTEDWLLTTVQTGH